MIGIKEAVVTKVDHNQGAASWVDVTTTREAAVTATIDTAVAMIITIEVVATKVVTIIIIIITDKATAAIITAEKVHSVAIIDRLGAMTLRDA